MSETPSLWSRARGWRVLVLLAGPVAALAALGLAVPHLPWSVVEGLPRWVFEVRHTVVGLRPEDLAILLGNLGVLGLALALLDAWRWLGRLWPLVPALVYAAGVSLAWMLQGVRVQAPLLRDWARLVDRTMGVEVVVAIGAGLLVVGLALVVGIGWGRACPACGTWWGEVLRTVSTSSRDRSGGRYSASGWVRTRTVEVEGHQRLRCRGCDHEWSRAFRSVQRYEKDGVLSSWKRR